MNPGVSGEGQTDAEPQSASRARTSKLSLRSETVNISGFFWPSGLLPDDSPPAHNAKTATVTTETDEHGSVPIKLYEHRNLNFMSFSHVMACCLPFEFFQPFKNIKTLLSSTLTTKLGSSQVCEPLL